MAGAIIVRCVTILLLGGGGNSQGGCNYCQGRNNFFKFGGGVILRDVAIIVRGVISFLNGGGILFREVAIISGV